MASLGLLPTELLDEIIPHLAQPELHNLCLTSWRLHAVAEPTLYKHISLRFTHKDLEPSLTCTQCGISRTSLLLRTLTQHPSRANLITSLTYHAAEDWATHHPSSSIENSETWLCYVEPGRLYGFYRALFSTALLSRCINLTSLSMPHRVICEEDWFEAFLSRSFREDKPWFNKIASIHLYPPSSNETIQPLDRLHLLLFYLPSLRKYEISNLVDEAVGAPDQWPTPSWPTSSVRPFAPLLTTLCLRESSIQSETLCLLLAYHPRLRTLELDLYQLELDSVRGGIDFGVFKEGLELVKDSLERLVFRMELIIEERFDGHVQHLGNVARGRIGSLRGFHKLRQLEISLAALFGEDCTVKPDLGCVLPSGLERLCITDDFFKFLVFEGVYEDGNAMEIFKRYLEGAGGAGDGSEQMSWQLATPGLEELEYDLRNWGFLSPEFWMEEKRRKLLEDMGRKQGVKCKVLIDDKETDATK